MDPEGGLAGVDETFVGSKLINMHKDKKMRYERRGGYHGKSVVMRLLDRDQRRVRAKVVPNLKREILVARRLGRFTASRCEKRVLRLPRCSVRNNGRHRLFISCSGL